MDIERIVGSSHNWSQLKDIFHDMGISVSGKGECIEHISHGVMVVHDGECLFLQMDHTYEYKSILVGDYSGAKLYHYLSLITRNERNLLLESPLTQWSMMFGLYPMPEVSVHKMDRLQQYLPTLYTLIPMDNVSDSHLITIPKGRSEKDEFSVCAALRELEEETSIKLHGEDLSILTIDRATGTDGNKYITHIYAAFIDSKPTITLSNEFNSHIWLSPSDTRLMHRQSSILQEFIRVHDTSPTRDGGLEKRTSM